MRIAVFGSGGVGGYFGGRLAQAGEEVVLIARGEHLQTLRDRGLRIDSPKGDVHLPSIAVTDDPAEIGVVGLVLIAVKAWQIPQIAPALRPMLGPETMLLPLQNGVEAPDQLASVVGHRHVLGGLCEIVAFVSSPGCIHHAGAEPRVRFGELDNRASERTHRLLQAFGRASGFEAVLAPDIHAAMWQKFLFIAPTSGVGAVSRVPLGILRAVPETRQMIVQGMREILDVARARSISLSDRAIEKAMALLATVPADGVPSMQRDIVAGRPSELEAQNGAVVRLGREVGVATPIHTFIYNSLLPAEKIARGQLQA